MWPVLSTIYMHSRGCRVATGSGIREKSWNFDEGAQGLEKVMNFEKKSGKSGILLHLVFSRPWILWKLWNSHSPSYNDGKFWVSHRNSLIVCDIVNTVMPFLYFHWNLQILYYKLRCICLEILWIGWPQWDIWSGKTDIGSWKGLEMVRNLIGINVWQPWEGHVLLKISPPTGPTVSQVFLPWMRRAMCSSR